MAAVVIIVALYCCCKKNGGSKVEKSKPNKYYLMNLMFNHPLCLIQKCFRPKVGDPWMFVGKRISKKVSSHTWKKGTVTRIINMEVLNTLFEVEWEDGSVENLRLYEDYLNEEVWLEEEQKDVSNFMAEILMGKLLKKSKTVASVDEKTN